MKKTLKIIGFVLVVCFGLIYISGHGYLLSAFSKIYLTGHTTAFLEDYKHFDNNIIPASKNPVPWPLHKDFNRVSAPDALKKHLEETKTVAFLIFKSDSLFYEKYYENYGPTSKSNSFSMVKSMISALLGKAIMDGHVASLDQPVKDFIPELKGPYASVVTMGDLSSMASGLEWDESYSSPFSITTAAYFVNDLRSLILKQPISTQPGQKYVHKSGATQLLGIALERAIGKSMSDYLYSSFWNPMGAENEAYWQVDSKKDNLEKAYCCLASNARDFARFGKLYKDYGRWNGQQLLDSAFIAKSLTPRFKESPQHGYGWWLKNYKNNATFMMRGHLGQCVIVVPEEDLIIVRLGHKRGKKSEDNPFSEDIDIYIEAGLRMTQSVVKN